jgi:non-structural maintenance of chromosomes element 4
MARLNARRSPSTDSLYRGRTPLDSRANTPAGISDKENQNPHTERSKSSASMNPPSRPPLTAAQKLSIGNKRRRLDSPQTRIDQILSQHPRRQESDDTKYFDPEQDENLRRDLRLEIRENHRDIHGMSSTRLLEV